MYHYVHISLKVACVVKIENENLKTLTSSNYPKVQYFLLKLRTPFLLTNVYERVCAIFLFCLHLELFAKI